MIKPLTSLRFFFALLVFLSHIGFIFDGNVGLKTISNDVFQEGYLGVSFFFILSGFILALNYRDKLLTKQVSTKKFWVARVARIYPLHLFTLIISLPLAIYQDEITFKWLAKLAANILLLQSFIPAMSIYFSFNAPSWSISDELFFYLLFPLIILIHQRFKLASFLNLIILLLIPIGIYMLPDKVEHSLFYINPIFRLADFSLGILLYYAYSKINHNFSLSIFKATLLELLAGVIFIVFFLFHNYVPQGYRFSCYYWIAMVTMIFIFAIQSGFISRLLSMRMFVLLGEISFSFYLLHQLVIRYVVIINNKLMIFQNEYLLFLFIFFTTLIGSYLCYKFIELPANRYVKRIGEKFSEISTGLAGVIY